MSISSWKVGLKVQYYKPIKLFTYFLMRHNMLLETEAQNINWTYVHAVIKIINALFCQFAWHNQGYKFNLKIIRKQPNPVWIASLKFKGGNYQHWTSKIPDILKLETTLRALNNLRNTFSLRVKDNNGQNIVGKWDVVLLLYFFIKQSSYCF